MQLSNDNKVVDAQFTPVADAKENTTEPTPAKPAEVVTGSLKKHEFQAETRKLLDIVANSLYSEKEVSVFPKKGLGAARFWSTKKKTAALF